MGSVKINQDKSAIVFSHPKFSSGWDPGLFDHISVRGGICDLIKFLFNLSLKKAYTTQYLIIKKCKLFLKKFPSVIFYIFLVLSMPQVIEQSLFLFSSRLAGKWGDG